MKLEDEAMPVRWRTNLAECRAYCAADSKPMILATALGRITGLVRERGVYGAADGHFVGRLTHAIRKSEHGMEAVCPVVCGGGVRRGCGSEFRIGRCRPGRGSTRCHEHYGSSHSLNRSTPGKRKRGPTTVPGTQPRWTDHQVACCRGIAGAVCSSCWSLPDSVRDALRRSVCWRNCSREISSACDRRCGL